MIFKEFILKFEEIKKIGFIVSLRRGNTGIGYTLETMLNISESNIALPDLGDIELKSTRNNSNSLITLFTFNNKAWQMRPMDAIDKYGSVDCNGRKGMYYSVSRTPNSANLFFLLNDKEVIVQHTSGEILLKWSIDSVLEKFEKKVKALILVQARVEERDGKEYFHYYRGQLLKGTTKEIIRSAFIEDNIIIDLRLHDRGTESARNHGTAFRVYERNLSSIYSIITDLEDMKYV